MATDRFLELAKARRSVRDYAPDPVPDDLLMDVIEAARWAPSAVNVQPWELIIVTDADLRGSIAEHARYMALRWPHIRSAPVLIAVCATTVTKFSRDDCMFAGANIMLAAADAGLGSCWIGGFDEQVVGKLLSVPEGYILPGMCTIGYAAGETSAPPKRPREDMIHREAFGGKRGGLANLRGPAEAVGRILKLQFRRGKE